jgi:hypothetical protein
MDSQRETVQKFIDRINSHDVDGVVALMADDYCFVNSSGDSYHGRDFMRAEWTRHFDRYPDFKIIVNTMISGPEGVGVFGHAAGTYTDAIDPVDEDDQWDVPAAFLGMARGGKMVHWQVFSDGSVVLDIIKEHGREG